MNIDEYIDAPKEAIIVLSFFAIIGSTILGIGIGTRNLLYILLAIPFLVIPILEMNGIELGITRFIYERKLVTRKEKAKEDKKEI